MGEETGEEMGEETGEVTGETGEETRSKRLTRGRGGSDQEPTQPTQSEGDRHSAVITDEKGKKWGPGTCIFIGWPNLPQLQHRVCLWVEKCGSKWVGYFARVGKEDQTGRTRTIRSDKAVMALELSQAVKEAWAGVDPKLADAFDLPHLLADCSVKLGTCPEAPRVHSKDGKRVHLDFAPKGGPNPNFVGKKQAEEEKPKKKPTKKQAEEEPKEPKKPKKKQAEEPKKNPGPKELSDDDGETEEWLAEMSAAEQRAVEKRVARRAAEKAAVEVQRAAEQRVADEQKRAAEEQAEKRSPKRPASPDTKALLQEQAEKIARLEAQLRAAQTPPSRPKPKLKRKSQLECKYNRNPKLTKVNPKLAKAKPKLRPSPRLKLSTPMSAIPHLPPPLMLCPRTRAAVAGRAVQEDVLSCSPHPVAHQARRRAQRAWMGPGTSFRGSPNIRFRWKPCRG